MVRGSRSRTDGKLWFVTGDGVQVVDPRHLPFNKLPPPVHIEQITADHKIRWQNLWSEASSNLRLPRLTRDLEIDYTALSLVAPEKVRFKYKLEGYDGDWQDAGNRRQAYYTNLAPTNYRFRVIACNNSGVWNEAGASLNFSIAPAYYQTTWFRALCGAVFLTMIWAVYRLRVRVLEERHRILERHRSEIRALNEQLMKAHEEERMRICGRTARWRSPADHFRYSPAGQGETLKFHPIRKPGNNQRTAERAHPDGYGDPPFIA